MKIYLGTVEIESVQISPDLPISDNYKAPEQQTVYIKIQDHSGGAVIFRLGRNDYDFFRKRVIEMEGYPK